MYINTTTQTPVSENDIRALYPNTSFPSPFTPPAGYLFLFPAPQPTYSQVTQSVRKATPELTSMGHWEQRWEVVELYSVIADKNAAIAAALSASKAAKWEAIKDIRDLKVQSGGYKVVVSSVDKWFHSDTFSRTQQMGLVMFGASCPAVPWKTLDGSYVTMSPSLAGQIFAAAASQDQNTFGRADVLRAAVNASANPDSVDINAGWPATYLGV